MRLFTRTTRGARLTVDGQAFLPPAREPHRVASRADGRCASTSSTGGSRPPCSRTTSTGRTPRSSWTARVIDEPDELLVGQRHPLADAPAVTPARLSGHRIWMPGMARGTEWAAYYDELSAEIATFIGEGSRYLWPDSYDLRRVPVRDPSPVYPMSLIRRADNPHPALADLRRFLADAEIGKPGTWTPTWNR